jgi:plastocyanin
VSRRGASLLVLGALVVGGNAAVMFAPGGGANPGGTSAKPRIFRVTVKASEYKFVLSRKAVPTSGTVIFTVVNTGKLTHDFKILGTKTRLLKPGQNAILRIVIKKKGRYSYICTVPGHAKLGMKGIFYVGVKVPKIAPNQSTGLDFPGSASVSTTMRFRFPNPQNNGLPAYGPNGRGVTYIWKAYPRQQHGYYTTFFWGNDGQFQPSHIYYGFHPFPDPHDGCLAHFWEIAGDGGNDYIGDHVAYNTWYTQVARVWINDDGTKMLQYYWNWPNEQDLIAHTVSSSGDNTNPANPALTWGDAPWPSASGTCGGGGQGEEVYDGIIRGIQIYSNRLSLTNIRSEINHPLSTAAGSSYIWYLNVNPTPSDISDKSGKNHNPTWVGSERPTLYTG